MTRNSDLYLEDIFGCDHRPEVAETNADGEIVSWRCRCGRRIPAEEPKASAPSPRIEGNAFIRLGGLLSTAVGWRNTALRDATLSACYALGAEQRYGEAPAWGTVGQEQREQIYAAVGKDCPNALARLFSMEK